MSHFRGDIALSIAGVLCCSMANNNLTNYGKDMSGVKAIAAALPSTQISDLKCAAAQYVHYLCAI
jgi:hypothetical protein